MGFRSDTGDGFVLLTRRRVVWVAESGARILRKT